MSIISLELLQLKRTLQDNFFHTFYAISLLFLKNVIYNYNFFIWIKEAMELDMLNVKHTKMCVKQNC